ncbi:MAG: hypothetical protein ACI4U6_06400 [Acutalibacteraceae bacterium]
MVHNDNILKERFKNMFKKAELEIYDLDLNDIIVTSDPNANLDDDDDIVIWPK